MITYRTATVVACALLGLVTLALAPTPRRSPPGETGRPAAAGDDRPAAGRVEELVLLLGMELPQQRLPAPDFALPRLSGGALRLADLAGQVVFLNFWATWCPPCRAEMPAMERLHRALGPRGLAVVAVDFQETADEIHAFVAELGLTFPVLLDESGAVTGGRYLVNALPTTFVLDRQGRIVAHAVGPRDWDGAAARTLFETLLAEAGPGSRASRPVAREPEGAAAAGREPPAASGSGRVGSWTTPRLDSSPR